MTDAEIAEARGITVQQVKNLRTLAKYLREKVDPCQFDMEWYCIDENSEQIIELAKRECGTTACAVGHGPMAGISTDGYESWWDYAKNEFIQFDLSDEHRTAFLWMFDAGWDLVDNSPAGAADRIDTFLRSGVPLWFDADMYFGTTNE